MPFRGQKKEGRHNDVPIFVLNQCLFVDKSIDSAAEVSVAECVVDSCNVWEVFILNIALVRETSF